MDLAARKKVVEPKYQAALADLDSLTSDAMWELWRELRNAGLWGQSHTLAGRWRQNRSQKRQQMQDSSTGTSGSNSMPTSAPQGESSSGTS